MRVEPDPTPEELAATMAALEALRAEKPQDRTSLHRSHWRLAGLFGHAVPTQMKLDGSLWSYSSWEGMT